MAEKADDISFALMLTLEKLSAAERAAFLLHDVFDLSFDEIAKALERSETSCRKLASRARQKVRASREDVLPNPTNDPLVSSFMAALKTGEIEDFVDYVAKDAVLFTDGGGLKSATLLPIFGREKILRFFFWCRQKVRAPYR